MIDLYLQWWGAWGFGKVCLAFFLSRWTAHASLPGSIVMLRDSNSPGGKKKIIRIMFVSKSRWQHFCLLITFWRSERGLFSSMWKREKKQEATWRLTRRSMSSRALNFLKVSLIMEWFHEYYQTKDDCSRFL